MPVSGRPALRRRGGSCGRSGRGRRRRRSRRGRRGRCFRARKWTRGNAKASPWMSRSTRARGAWGAGTHNLLAAAFDLLLLSRNTGRFEAPRLIQACCNSSLSCTEHGVHAPFGLHTTSAQETNSDHMSMHGLPGHQILLNNLTSSATEFPSSASTKLCIMNCEPLRSGKWF